MNGLKIKRFVVAFLVQGFCPNVYNFYFYEKKNWKLNFSVQMCQSAGHTQGCQYPKNKFLFWKWELQISLKFTEIAKFNRLTKMFSVVLNEFSKNICQIKTY